LQKRKGVNLGVLNMATLTHDAEYPCAFELKLLDWERYSPNEDTDIKTVPSGEPYTLWIKLSHGLASRK
jgi:hypothetical protein